MTTDVRIIAATNQDLDALIASGRFRSDLYYRLNGFTIRLPPLRDRKDDIPLLADHFLRRAATQLGRPVRSFAPDVLMRLSEYDWPGNVRELAAAIRYAVIHASGDVVTTECLPDSCGRTKAGAVRDSAMFDLREATRQMLASDEGDMYRRLSLLADRIVLEETMRHFRGNQARAAEKLGISRVTLRSRLRQLGMLDG